jgi:hypothetical protein
MYHVNSWSDDNEHTLDMIRLNSVNLSEQHYSKYQEYKRRLNYVKYPVIAMSAVNVYAAVGLPQYVQQQYVSIRNATISSLVVLVVLLDLLMGTQSKLEKEIVKYIEYKQIGKQIYEVLALEKVERKLDAKMFLDMKYTLYESLAETNELITKFKDIVLSRSEKFINSPIMNKDDPMVQKLHNHWNILFQPSTFQLKSIENEKDVESQVDVAPSESKGIEEIYEKKESHLFSNFFKNPFKALLPAGEETEAEAEAEKDTKTETEKPKDDMKVEFIEREPTSPETKSDKKLGMNFMSKI